MRSGEFLAMPDQPILADSRSDRQRQVDRLIEKVERLIVRMGELSQRVGRLEEKKT